MIKATVSRLGVLKITKQVDGRNQFMVLCFLTNLKLSQFVCYNGFWVVPHASQTFFEIFPLSGLFIFE